MSENPPSEVESTPNDSPKQQAPSGLTYRLVTKYWPRMAAGLVGLAVVAEWVIGGLTSNGALEFYVFAWATTTGGLWFLFEKAEKALSEESREKVVGWVQEKDFGSGFESIPAQFALLFDRVFGERHLSWRCFFRSSLASVIVVITMSFVVLAMTGSRLQHPGFFLWLVFVLNVVPDYISLLETRWMIRRMSTPGRVVMILSADTFLTAFISWFANFAQNFGYSVGINRNPISMSLSGAFDVSTDLGLLNNFNMIGGLVGPAVFFWSAFFTSVWLWLYAGSFIVSRVLTHMNKGIGFLLQVTDVERQPFRSMGFVCVLITTGLFLLGLPLVLL